MDVKDVIARTARRIVVEHPIDNGMAVPKHVETRVETSRRTLQIIPRDELCGFVRFEAPAVLQGMRAVQSDTPARTPASARGEILDESTS